MATDQCLLESVDQSGIPCLRFYRWPQPTLSLGYFQEQKQRQYHVESESLGLVRRATGGGAIIHHHELTYSIAIRNDHPSLSKRSKASETDRSPSVSAIGANARLYRLVHHAIASALTEFGVAARPFYQWRSAQSAVASASKPEPFLCFQRRTSEDLIVAGYKVLGSAQRRGKRSLLQHGSLLIRSSVFAPQLPGVVNLGAKMTDAQDLVEPIVTRLERELNVHWRNAPITADEEQRGLEIADRRFARDTWNCRR
jgi:lipoate-protein ligase A